MISQMEMVSGCQIRVSASGCVFPGTQDRAVSISGTQDAMDKAMELVLRQYINVTSKNRSIVKIVIPRSSASILIGSRGESMRSFQESTGCIMAISERVEELQERIVCISGPLETVIAGAQKVVRQIQEDHNLMSYTDLAYDVQLPLGVWDSREGALPAVAPADLVSPALARTMTKRELVEYLRKAAPRSLLLQRHLLGSEKNTLKGQNWEELIDAATTVWCLHHPGIAEEDARIAETLLTSEALGKVIIGSAAWIMKVAQKADPWDRRDDLVEADGLHPDAAAVDSSRRTGTRGKPAPATALPVGQIQPGTAKLIVEAATGRVEPPPATSTSSEGGLPIILTASQLLEASEDWDSEPEMADSFLLEDVYLLCGLGDPLSDDAQQPTCEESREMSADSTLSPDLSDDAQVATCEMPLMMSLMMSNR